MKRILAHNECDAQKRRDAFGERYNAYIEAEAYALNHGLVIPCNYNEGYCLTRYDVFGNMATIDCIDWETNVNTFTGEEIAASRKALLGY